MTLLQTGIDHWGREVVLGVQGGLFWVALGLSALMIAGHMLYRSIRRRGLKRGGESNE